ncbi:TetR/AcrR family transcriptional regulator [Otariodibacter oris]|uniref:TetR family transcriptional regulator n=1 Tax=Otariodibacter oris TaxID=1032623 RepID=A0A420XGQ3_9PAST|nr:TetR/AcrR family transcriptional regulator [Otariodibacter oris]QGM80020.1 TetR family transcriptional regulator [Otariodibacter oris]RKR71844.1 TetR family transcriptional regulator [Otariodibacter oris]
MNGILPIEKKHSDTKSHILDVGYQLIAQKGFTAVGLKQILDTAGIPKGSFYHYFESKEAFGEELIEHYSLNRKKLLEQISNKEITAQQKLYEYFKCWYDTQKDGCSGEKCLIVKLSGEVADISDIMRLALARTYQTIIDWISLQIKAGWEDGSLPQRQNISAESIASRWYYAWLGASLVTKISQSEVPLTEVWNMMLSELDCTR